MSSPLSLNPRMVLNSQSSSVGRHGSTLAPPLEKYTSSADEIIEIKTYLGGQSTCVEPLGGSYMSAQIINNQIKELQVNIFLMNILDVTIAIDYISMIDFACIICIIFPLFTLA